MKFNLFSKKEGEAISDHVIRNEDVNYITEKRPKETWKERHTGMNFPMIFYISLKNLKVNRTRSILTIGGVALGIGIITFLLSVGFGMQRMIVAEVTKDNPINVLNITNGNLDNFVSLNNDYIDKIIKIEGVEKIERRVNTGGKIILGESTTDVIIYGTTSQYLDISRVNYDVNGGRFINNENNAIISDQLATLLGFENPYDAIGKDISYSVAISKDISSKTKEEKFSENKDTKISAIISGTDRAFIYLPFKILQDNFEIDAAQEGKVVVSDINKLDSIKQRLDQMGFVTDSIVELIAGIDSFFNTARVVLAIFGIIVMSISVMGMLNTLSVSLLQRTKEIGILKALGAKRSDVFKMFILESIIISFVGGVVGFLAGYGFALLVNKILIFFGEKMGAELGYFMYVPVSFIFTISGFIFFLGIVTGVMPAFRASKIHALEALRYE